MMRAGSSRRSSFTGRCGGGGTAHLRLMRVKTAPSTPHVAPIRTVGTKEDVHVDQIGDVELDGRMAAAARVQRPAAGCTKPPNEAASTSVTVAAVIVQKNVCHVSD